MAEAVNQQDTVIQNTFEGGMNLDGDRRPELNPKNTYTFALNAVNKTSHSSQVIGLSNEASFSSCPGVPQNAIGLALVEERNWSVFITPEAGGTVGIHDHRSCETEILFTGSEFSCDFGCTDCEWIGNNMEFKTMDPCSELHMYWSCGCNYYKVNIDLMRDPARKAGLMREINCNSCKDKQDCKVFEIFKCACAPKMSPKAYQSGGGTLPAGAYQFVLRYQYVDSGWTNWFNHSDPVFVGSEHNIGGEQGNGHIELAMSCLDCNMAAVEIAVIERSGGITTAKLLDKVYLNNESYSYNYTGQEGTDIAIEELLVKDKTYIEGKHLEQHKSRMLYYGLKHFKNLNYQYKANGISVGYNIYEMPYEQACRHNIRGLMRGETYAFGIVWNYKDGSHSRVFHIPGAPSGGNTDNGLSQTFQDTFNPSPFGDGSSAAGTANIGAAGNVNTDQEVVCEFEDVDDNIDISYNSLLKAGEADTLNLFITGNASATDILECIKECIDSGKSTRIYVTGHNGDEITFDAYSYTQTADSNLSLLGNTNTTAVGDARHIAVVHKEGTATGPTQGGSGSGGSGGGGQSQVSGSPSVSITTPACVVRKRSHIPDQVSDPQQDDWDDKVQEMLSSLETVVEDECEELRLIEEARMAQCCQCKDSATIYPPESCGPDGSINVSVAGDPDTGEGAVSVSGTIPADCAAPFVCCETGPMCTPGKAYEQCMEDLNDLDHGAADYASVLEDYLLDELDVTFNATSMNDAAVIIMNAIQQRERKYRKQQEFNVSKSVSYGSGGTDPRDGDSRFGDIYTDCCGNRDSDLDLRIVSSGRPTPKYERDITYPCSTDCSGNALYGGLADTPVSHSQFPDACQEPHYVSKSIGVPHGTFWGDANEYGDGYVRIMGPTFDNITFPTEQELPKDLCERNPYTIVMVKRTDSNKEILLKGLATGTFLIDNNGKQYEQPRHGVNSLVEVSRYHDGGGKHPRLSNGGSGSSFNVFSLDGCTRKPALDADVVIEELRLTGQGERYGLYAMGDLPLDQENGQRVDKLGARQAVNLNQWSAGGCSEIPLDFKIYAPARGSNVGGGIAPPAGGSTPLMQAFQQESIWIGAGLPQIVDHSFQGDVLEHNAPINYAEASYVTLKKNRDNQYGNLENLNYIPILQAGKNNGGSIEGAVGDTYIGPYSFVKTGYVSDKVGSCEEGCKFNIPAQEPTKQERRCVCDSPEDVIHNYTKGHIWSKLPESGDVANPWNWAGTRTHDLNHTDTISEAVGGAAVSGYYAPKTVTTNITYWGEHETNPWLRQKSDNIREQWYPEISREFQYDAGVEVDANGGKWNNSWLSQFGCERRQPSQKQEKQLAMWRTVLTIIGPMLMALGMGKSNDTFGLTGQLASSGYFTSMWHMLNQVLYDNNKLEEILGIPVCKSDDVGGQGDGCIAGFFTNPCTYNFDYSAMNEIYPYCGMPDQYYVCDCLSWDTPILMSDFSQKNIEDVEIGEYVKSFDFETKEYKDSKILTKWDRGVKDVYRIKLSNHQHVDATLNHKWFAYNRNKREGDKGYNTVIEVTTQDLINSPNKYALVHSGQLNNKSETYLTKDEAYILGMYIAEGSRPYKVKPEEELVRKRKKYNNKYFISQFKKHTREKIKRILVNCDLEWKEHTKGFYISKINNTKLDTILNSIERGAINKRIPTEVFDLEKTVLQSLYEGLIDGDGSRRPKKVNKDGSIFKGSDVYYTCSKELANDVALLGSLVGKPMYVKNRGKVSGFGSKRDQYTVVGSYNSRLRTGKVHIKSIDLTIAPAHTYDIEIEGTHSFVIGNCHIFSHNCDNCAEENQTSNEIYYSEEQVQGSHDDAYGNIKPLNRVTIDPSEGKLTNLISQGSTLYYHTTDVFRPLAEGRVLLASNIGEVLLGTGGFLQHTGGGGPVEGYAGLQHHNHQINTQYGYFWVDQEAAKIFRLHNNSIDVISDKSAFNFFKEHLPFCEETECKNEQKAGTSYYALGVDPRLNRFLITKNDGNNKGSFTLSYDLERDQWISFHSYDDVRAYNWDRYNSYALTPQGYWKMNDTNCDFGNFCSGRENFEVRFSAASPRLDEFQYRYTDVDLLVEECSGCVFTRDIDNFFDEIALYNSTESTGWLTSDVRSDNRGSDESAIDNITDLACGVVIKKRHRHWNYNQIHDKVDIDCGQCVPMLECDECEPFPRLNQGIINCDSNNKQDYKNRHLSDRFVTYWYVWDHAKRPQQNITLLRNTTYTDEHID